MGILYRYLRHFWKLAVAALVLAAINQVFSLLDPLIFRHIIDSYATRHREYSSSQFLRGVSVRRLQPPNPSPALYSDRCWTAPAPPFKAPN